MRPWIAQVTDNAAKHHRSTICTKTFSTDDTCRSRLWQFHFAPEQSGLCFCVTRTDHPSVCCDGNTRKGMLMRIHSTSPHCAPQALHGLCGYRRQTLVTTRVMIAKHGTAVHCRCDCPFHLKVHAIQSLTWCSHCGPVDASAHQVLRKVLNLRVCVTVLTCRFFLSQFKTAGLPFCTHP